MIVCYANYGGIISLKGFQLLIYAEYFVVQEDL